MCPINKLHRKHIMRVIQFNNLKSIKFIQKYFLIFYFFMSYNYFMFNIIYKISLQFLNKKF